MCVLTCLNKSARSCKLQPHNGKKKKNVVIGLDGLPGTFDHGIFSNKVTFKKICFFRGGNSCYRVVFRDDYDEPTHKTQYYKDMLNTNTGKKYFMLTLHGSMK